MCADVRAVQCAAELQAEGEDDTWVPAQGPCSPSGELIASHIPRKWPLVQAQYLCLSLSFCSFSCDMLVLIC